MLFFFVVIYILLTLAIGIYSARKVKSSSDFILAGRRLPLFMATATVFATWFGSETILGASSRFAEEGILGVIEDPFGASLCLLLVGLFFARRLYRMNLTTFGDFYKFKFGPVAEKVAAVSLIISYFGWIAAQFVAIGIVINLLSGLNLYIAIIISASIVIAYTYYGGMWSVSVTDFFQTIMIVIGLVAAILVIVPQAGGIESIIKSVPDEKLQFLPSGGTYNWLAYIAAWITLGLGSIPQQDVYQRVMSSKSENVAVTSSLLAAAMYLTIAIAPLMLALAAKNLNIEHVHGSQFLLPHLILEKSGIVIQVLFFGALVSAILSTASGALLAPSVILSENILRSKKQNGDETEDKRFLKLSRYSVLIVATISLLMALVRKDIYELVSEASAISLVSLFVPLVAGLFFNSTKSLSAIVSMIGGLVVWFICVWIETLVPPILLGLAASAAGYAIVSLVLKK